MFKSVKGKVVAGVVSVGLLSGVGAAFANTDAGTQLQNWYNSQFSKASTGVKAAATLHGAGQVSGLTREYNTLKTGTGTAINDEKGLKTGEANTEIQAAAQSRIVNVNQQTDIIKGNMDQQFTDLFNDAQATINKAGDFAYAWAQKDLGKYTSDKGAKALADMDTELTATKKKAVDDLTAAITNAKNDLNAQLRSKSAATTVQINHAIDAKIAELRGLIQQKASDLVEAQKALIEKKSADYVKAAEGELDTVVDGI
jgi:hypothetical protein